MVNRTAAAAAATFGGSSMIVMLARRNSSAIIIRVLRPHSPHWLIALLPFISRESVPRSALNGRRLLLPRRDRLLRPPLPQGGAARFNVNQVPP